MLLCIKQRVSDSLTTYNFSRVNNVLHLQCFSDTGMIHTMSFCPSGISCKPSGRRTGCCQGSWSSTRTTNAIWDKQAFCRNKFITRHSSDKGIHQNWNSSCHFDYFICLFLFLEWDIWEVIREVTEGIWCLGGRGACCVLAE